jgi:hypothetical protein
LVRASQEAAVTPFWIDITIAVVTALLLTLALALFLRDPHE